MVLSSGPSYLAQNLHVHAGLLSEDAADLFDSLVGGRFKLYRIPSDVALLGSAKYMVRKKGDAFQPVLPVEFSGAFDHLICIVHPVDEGVFKGDEKPLLVVDDEVFTGNIEDIKPENVKSMTVLKGKAAETVFGEKGKNGVIDIKTKKKKIQKGLSPFEYLIGLFDGLNYLVVGLSAGIP